MRAICPIGDASRPAGSDASGTLCTCVSAPVRPVPMDHFTLVLSHAMRVRSHVFVTEMAVVKDNGDTTPPLMIWHAHIEVLSARQINAFWPTPAVLMVSPNPFAQSNVFPMLEIIGILNTQSIVTVNKLLIYK